MNNKNFTEYGMIKGGIILIDKTTSSHKFYKQLWSQEKKLISKSEALNLISAFEEQFK